MKQIVKELKNWEKFHTNRLNTNFPIWPNEILLKILFGNYLSKKIKLPKNSNILDVGCGFGNNLLPFKDFNFNLFGTEVTKKTALISKKILNDKGIVSDIKKGTNQSLPFKNNFFDLLISINVLHYEKNLNGINKSLKEYKRVLKNNGNIIIFTVGPKHLIYKKAKSLDNHVYEIHDWDFRNNSKYFYFDNEKYLELYMKKFFKAIEIGRVTEKLMKKPLDFLICKANK